MFSDKGYATQLDVEGPELQAMRDRIYSLYTTTGLEVYRTKANVLYQEVDAFTRSPKVMALAEAVLGRNFHCWDAMIWAKGPQSSVKVSAHQDATYWNFSPKEHAFVLWVPLQDVDEVNGTLYYAKGPRLHKQIMHVDAPSGTNLLSRGQTVEQVFDYEPVNMEYGKACAHDPFAVHLSYPNLSGTPRLALNFMFVSYSSRPLIGVEYTMHLSGDPTAEWLYSPRPTSDVGIDAWAEAYTRTQRPNYLALKHEHIYS